MNRLLLLLCCLLLLPTASTVQAQTGGTVVGWGLNEHGQTTVPDGLTSVVQIAAGEFHSLVRFADGTVAAWGSNADGQTTMPDGLSNVVQAAAGYHHNLALRDDGTVVAWGSNGVGQTDVPTDLTNPVTANVVQVAGGGLHNLALRDDGTVVAWGYNEQGQSTVPANLTNPVTANVVQVAGGGLHNLALRDDGTVVAWGYNEQGQSTVPANLTNPVTANVVQVAGGNAHSLALLANGTVVAWGWDAHGQTAVPTGLTNVVQLAAGGHHNLALRDDGTVVAWGLNGNGQSTVPDGLTNVVQVSGGNHTSLALRQHPQASVNPTSLFFQMAPDEIDSRIVTLSNGGDGTLVYDISVAKAPGQPRTITHRPGGITALTYADGLSLTTADGVLTYGPYIEMTGSPFLFRRGGDEVTITHSASTAVTTRGVACSNPTAGYTTQNSYWRVFDLSDFGLGDGLDVTSVDLGVGRIMLNGNNPVGTTVRLHTLNGTFDTSNLTEVGSATFTVGDVHQGQLVSIPITASLNAGDVLVVEWDVPTGNPADTGLPNPFDIRYGANSFGQTGPTYMSSECMNNSQPADVTSLGAFGHLHWVLRVNGIGNMAPAAVSVDPTSGTVAANNSVQLEITANSTGLAAGTHEYVVQITTSDPDNLFLTVDVMLVVDAPHISVGPTDLSIEQTPNVITSHTLEISNTGVADLVWSIEESEASSVWLGFDQEISIQRADVDVGTDALLHDVSGISLESVPAYGTLLDPAPGRSHPIELHLDTGIMSEVVGVGGAGAQILWLNRFTPDPSDFPFILEEVRVFFNAPAVSNPVQVGDVYDVYVYQDADGNPANGATLAGSTTGLTVTALGVFLDTPVNILVTDPGDVLIAVVNRTARSHPAVIDNAGTAGSHQRSWVGFGATPGNPPVLETMPTFALIDNFIAGNWMIRGYGRYARPCSTPEDIPWLSVNPVSGTTAPDDVSEVNVELNSTGLSAGLYEALFCIESNDPLNPLVIVPVSMMVTEGATYAIGSEQEGPGWRMLSAPLEDATVQTLANANLVYGIPGEYENTHGTNPLVGYNGEDFVAPTGLGHPLEPGKGFIWYLWDTEHDNGHTPAGSGISEHQQLPFDLTFTGSPVVENHQVIFTEAERATEDDGWYLIGNPYATPYNVGGIFPSSGSFSMTYHHWDAADNGAYVQLNGLDDDEANILAGFFMQFGTAPDLPVTITFGPSLSGSPGVPDRDVAERFTAHFELSGNLLVEYNGNQIPVDVSDRNARAVFSADATDGFDYMDSGKLNPLSYYWANVALMGMHGDDLVRRSVESRPLPQGPVTIPMALSTYASGLDAGGVFTITLTDNALGSGWQVRLNDLETGEVVNMLTDSYTFTIEAQPAIDADVRFEITFTPPTVSDDGNGETYVFGLEAIWPNPTVSTAQIGFTLETAGDVSLEVFDVLGRRVAQLANGEYGAGRHVLPMNVNALASGVYVVRLTASSQTAVQRVTVAR